MKSSNNLFLYIKIFRSHIQELSPVICLEPFFVYWKCSYGQAPVFSWNWAKEKKVQMNLSHIINHILITQLFFCVFFFSMIRKSNTKSDYLKGLLYIFYPSKLYLSYLFQYCYILLSLKSTVKHFLPFQCHWNKNRSHTRWHPAYLYSLAASQNPLSTQWNFPLAWGPARVCYILWVILSSGFW